MRAIIILAAVAGSLASFASPADAQTRLPRKSVSERQVDEINRSMQLQQRQLGVQQQNQIDNNQIRQGIDRQQMFARPSPPAQIRNCPPSSVGC